MSSWPRIRDRQAVVEDGKYHSHAHFVGRKEIG
jgi:hypothetical protein